MLSRALFVKLLLVCCCVLTTLASPYSKSNQDGNVHDPYLTDYSVEVRRTRSLVAVGNAALKTLLKGAKFLFSDGLNNVYQKSGGYAKALDDFNSVNTAKRVRNYPYPSKGNLYIKKVGQVGDRYLILRESRNTGSTSLTISKLPDRNAKYIDPTIDRVILYGD